MRAAGFTLALTFFAAGPAAAQHHGQHWHGDVHGDGHHHHHHHGGIRGPHYGYPVPAYGGYGLGYDAFYGPGLSAYRGPLLSGIEPPVYVYPPYGYGLGYGYGPSWGYGSAWYPPVNPDFLNNSLRQHQYDSDWQRLSADLADRALRNAEDPQRSTVAIPIPSSPEAKLKSLRYQAQGDEAFLKQDFPKALDRYRAAAQVARDDGRAFFKTGYAYFALGRFASALEYFKRGLVVEPTLALTGPVPEELYGDNQIAWTAHLGRLTQYVRDDVRDSQRVLLLGLLLFYDGDSRAREFLEKAWQLSGGTEAAVVTLLSPPEVQTVKVVEPGKNEKEPPQQGPALAPPTEELDPSEIPEPPTAAPPLPGRPSNAAPLFPLPSDQSGALSPPLPAE